MSKVILLLFVLLIIPSTIIENISSEVASFLTTFLFLDVMFLYYTECYSLVIKHRELCLL